MIQITLSNRAVFNAELRAFRAHPLRPMLPAPAPLAPTKRGLRSSRITAAVDQYLAELGRLRASGELKKTKTYGVLKPICQRLGVKPSAVCTRIKREHPMA